MNNSRLAELNKLKERGWKTGEVIGTWLIIQKGEKKEVFDLTAGEIIDIPRNIFPFFRADI